MSITLMSLIKSDSKLNTKSKIESSLVGWSLVFARYRDRKHPAVIKANSLATAEVKRSKINFEMKLASQVKSDSKSFYAYVRSKSKSKFGISTLIDSNG